VGIPVREFQEYSNGNGHAGMWRTFAVGAWGLLIGSWLALFAALQGKGITQKDLQEYEDKFSPYVQERALLAEHNAVQDTQIGNLQGIQQQNMKHLTEHDIKLHDDERDFTEFKTATEKNNKYWSDWIEEQRKAKK
jgi:hypothetical protein